MARAFLGRFPKWKSNPALPPAPRLGDVANVAVDPDIPRQDLPALPGGLQALIGIRRCARANLFIIASMRKLQTFAASASKQQLVDLLYVIAMGVPAVTASTWQVAGGDPKKLRPTCVIYHAPAARATAREFVYTPQFAAEHLDVLNALRDCAALSKSVWNIKPLTPNPQPLAGGVERIQVTSLASLGQGILKARVLERWGCRAHATDLR